MCTVYKKNKFSKRSYPLSNLFFQAKGLCGQHIRAWIKQRGLFSRRLGLQRLRSMANLPGGPAVCDVYCKLEAISLEIERRHPKLYAGVCRQMGLTVANEKSIAKALSSLALEIFKTDITWFKIASFYNIVSGAAVDCVRQGHPGRHALLKFLKSYRCFAYFHLTC